MTDRDQEIRLAAFARCAQLIRDYGGAVTWDAIKIGFEFDGEQIYLAGKARGIHRPRQMTHGVLSIKTTKPRKGRIARYDDALGNDGYFSYAFQGDDPANHDNSCLREAFEDQSPLIYFYALVTGIYQILYPCYVIEWNADELRCTVAIGSQYELTQPSAGRQTTQPIDRRYSTIEAKVRLHQAEFRELGPHRLRPAMCGVGVADPGASGSRPHHPRPRRARTPRGSQWDLPLYLAPCRIRPKFVGDRP